MTDAEYSAWLDSDDAQRVVLLELGVNSGGTEATRYVASRQFISAATDSPASTSYEERLTGGLGVQESLGLFGAAASMSHGDIELHNMDGGLDAWLDDTVTNRAVNAWLGDVRWPKADFRQIYAGTIESLDSSARERITVRLADKLQRLNSSLTETKLGGTGPNADALIPLCFGECHNVTPLLVDSGTLEYAVHNGPIEDIIEVRDNGVPVFVTKLLSTGRFRLNQSPVGTITASVQGDKPSAYANDVGSLVERIVTAFGRTDLRFSGSDIDATALSAFKTANPQPVGLYLTDPVSVREACDQLAASVGARLAMTRLGLLRLVKIALPPGSSAATATEDDFAAGSLRIAQRSQVAAACKLAYCRNWTPQDLQTGLVAQHKELFAQPWLTATASDSTAATLHKLSLDVEQEDTLLLVKADADAEAGRRLALRKVQRTVYQFDAFARLLQLELGAGLTLVASRFGLDDGVVAQVVSLQIDWITGRVVVGVLR